jgi:uncharacterized protein DUF4253
MDSAHVRASEFSMMEIVGVEPIWKFVVPGDRAIDAWTRLSALHASTGHWPVLLGSDKDDVPSILEIANDDGTPPEEIVGEGIATDLRQLFERWARDASPEEDPEAPDIVGDWPKDAKPITSFATPFDVLSHKPLPTTIALMKVSHDWEVPAYLRWGNWNEVPPASAHVAVLRRWSQLYGSQLVAMTHDVVECRVQRPPSTREAAMALAREQFAYCSDIVHQGVGTISALAASIMNASVWYFWWD